MDSDNGTIRLGISTCLLGEKVRYDGQHKYDRFLVETLGKYVEFVPVCPEVECGLSIPRESMRLVGDPENPRLMTAKTERDLTEQMLEFARRRVKELDSEHLCGYVFKSKSPSSGMERVKVYPEGGGMPTKTGVGMFAREFMRHFPLLPVEEEGRLHDDVLRENFIERLFVMKRWRDLTADGPPSPSGLVDFHTRHKMLLMAHSPKHYREAGKLVADAGKEEATGVANRYLQLLMAGTALHATRRKHQNVLQHLVGHFKKDITADEKAEMLETIQTFRDGYVPLIVPVTLLNHFVRKYDKQYLADQVYLHPHPMELQLRNHC